MTSANQLTAAAKSAGLTRTKPGAIFAVISDDHNTHCLDEAMLDTWFLSQSPERKVEIYEQDMEGEIRDQAPAVLGLAGPSRLVEMSLAYERAAGVIESSCTLHLEPGDDFTWYDTADVDEAVGDVDAEVEYLASRNLVVRHAVHTSWISLCDEGEPLSPSSQQPSASAGQVQPDAALTPGTDAPIEFPQGRLITARVSDQSAQRGLVGDRYVGTDRGAAVLVHAMHRPSDAVHEVEQHPHAASVQPPPVDAPEMARKAAR